MKVILFFILSLVCILDNSAQTRKVHILSVNDMHAAIERFPQLAVVTDSLRNLYPDLLLLSAGDNRTGNPINDMHPEVCAPMITLMNAVGFNYSTLGNHEFDGGIDALRTVVNRSNCRYLCANINAPDSLRLHIEPFRIIRSGGVRVALLGLVQVGENGYPVTFIGRVSDSGAEIFEDAVCFDSDIVFVEGYGDVMVECVSANGLTLPVEVVSFESPEEGGNDYYRYVISTEYAKSGEIYSLNIYADNITDGTKRVFETRYITLADGESFLDYPEFDITAERDAQSGTYRIAIRHVSNELFENPDFAVFYVAELEDSNGRTEEIYLDDFAQVPEQKLDGEEYFNVAADITVRIACSIGESNLFYVLSVEKLYFEVAENR